jgi:hypothetical protein
MLKQIKQTNEKILKKHFEQSFGEESKVEVNWGFPIITVEITLNHPETKTIFKITFNSDTEDYDLSSYAIKMVDGKEIPDFASISKQVIDFIIKDSNAITEQFFTTKGYDPDAAPEKSTEVTVEETSEIGVEVEKEPDQEKEIKVEAPE